MCSHEKGTCVRCATEKAVEDEASLGERLDHYTEEFFLGNLSCGVPASRRWRDDQPDVSTNSLANGQAKLPNEGRPLSDLVALAQAEKHSAKEWVPDHVDEWWDSVQGARSLSNENIQSY